MPLQSTSGAASYDAFGGGVPVVPKYIEEYFSTFLYSGTGAAQTITNNIDLATKGGLVWYKSRSNVTDHGLVDTARGMTAGSSPILASNLTDSQIAVNNYVIANTTGFSFGSDATGTNANASGYTYTSWSWAKAPKFFDVVTYTATGSVTNIAHSLGSVPGCIIIKNMDDVDGWVVYHRSIGATKSLSLNTTAAEASNGASLFNSTTPTSTVFTIGTGGSVNFSGNRYVAYLFAHDAGGFGLTGTDNVISCGSFSGNTTVSLGFEPQWIMLKRTDAVGNWDMHDVMRGWPVSGDAARLRANLSDAESQTAQIFPNATGFSTSIGSGNYIYIAIRRGPMKTPTVGTSVFSPVAYSGTGATRTITAGFPVDLAIPKSRGATGNGAEWYSRLIGANRTMMSSGTFAEFAIANELTSFASNTGVDLGNSSTSGGTNASGSTYVDWNFQRAPSFFDEVCYTGTEVSGQTFNHNLGAVPEMMIVKARSGTTDWTVYHSALGASARIYLNVTNAANTGTAAPWNSTTPTSSVFSLGNAGATNLSGTTFVNYLFATCAGVSKIGSYTGNGTTQTIDCGFTGGARFVLIKRTDSTGDWYVYDTARGMTTLTDPYLLLNSSAAESATLGSVTTVSTGFALNSTILAAINVSGGTYIFLAIA